MPPKSSPRNASRSFSSSRRKVLGRGLESLFYPDEEKGREKILKRSGTLCLGIEQIQVNPRQPRRVFDKELLKELADSIRKNGLIQPVIVRKVGSSKYEIVAGERRWRAAGLAGLHEIPVRVLETDNKTPFLALVENLQREDLNPIELAQAYRVLMRQEKLTQEKLADQLGVARATLANQLRILKLPVEVRNLILEGQLSLALAKILLQEKNMSSQLKWAQYFAKHKTGVREAGRLLSQGTLKGKRGKAGSPQESKGAVKNWQKQALKKIQEVHGVKSTLRFKKKGGEFCLRFFSEEELRHLMNILLQSS